MVTVYIYINNMYKYSNSWQCKSNSKTVRVRRLGWKREMEHNTGANFFILHCRNQKIYLKWMKVDIKVH